MQGNFRLDGEGRIPHKAALSRCFGYRHPPERYQVVPDNLLSSCHPIPQQDEDMSNPAQFIRERA
jgi:hypothetical protein